MPFINKVYFGEVSLDYANAAGFNAFKATNDKFYEFEIQVYNDMLRIVDCLGRSVPLDVTQVDSLLQALVKSRELMPVPNFPDAFVDMDS